MNKQEVLTHLCEIVSRVGHEVYHDAIAYDCFCGEAEKTVGRDTFETVHPEVLAFISNAVDKAIAKRK